MTQTSLVPNPFMLMLDPEVVLAAVQRSEELEQLSRRVCHPLDRPTPVPASSAGPVTTGLPLRHTDDR